MYGRKLCLGLSRSFGMSYEEQIPLLKRTGFDGFFAEWSPDLELEGLMRIAEREGMVLQSLHAPFTKMADLWKKTERTEEAIDELIRCAQDCARFGAPIMVVHVFIGFDDHEPTEFGLRSYERVVNAAQQLGVKVAFENTEGEEYLDALMEHFKGNEWVGFCWDTGHELCYNYGKDMVARYGDRLLCTHLNDNLGIRDYEGKITWIDDLHLLPFDGIADWQGIAARLDSVKFDGFMTFELTIASKPGRHENDAYARMEPQEYIAQAYMRACRAAALRKG